MKGESVKFKLNYKRANCTPNETHRTGGFGSPGGDTMNKKRKRDVADENVIRKQCNSCGTTWTPGTPGYDRAEEWAGSTFVRLGVLGFSRCGACVGRTGR